MSEAEVRSRYEAGGLMQVRVVYMCWPELWRLIGLTIHQLRVDQMKVRRLTAPTT